MTYQKLYYIALPNSLLMTACILYKAIHSPADTVKLQEDLYALQHWQHRWLMKLNASKCFVMSISHPRRNEIISSYKIHNHFLSPVEHYKYLGITIQSDLKWHKHFQSITSRANLRIPSIHKGVALQYILYSDLRPRSKLLTC